jgi:uncharacterized phage protein (TIGR02218 family)
MKFPTASVGALNFRLLLVQPNWRSPIVVDHRFPTMITESRLSIEERRSIATTMRLTLKCELQPYGTASDDWRKGVYELGTELVGAPLWCDVRTPDQWANRIYSPGYVVNFDPDSDAFQIMTAASVPVYPLLPTYPYLAPLILGRWANRPDANAIAADNATVALELVEASPIAFAIAAMPNADQTWLQNPNWFDNIVDTSSLALEQLVLNQTREPALDGVDAEPRWIQKGNFTFSSTAEITAALSLFQNSLGAWGPFTVPVWFQPGAATPETPANYSGRFNSDTLTLNYENCDSATSTIAFIQEATGPVQITSATFWMFEFIYQWDPTHPELWTDCDAGLFATEGTYKPAQIGFSNLRLSLQPQSESAEFDMALSSSSLMSDWLLSRLYGSVSVNIWRGQGGGSRTKMFSGIVTKVRPNGAKITVSASLFGGALGKQFPSYSFQSRCNVRLCSTRCGLTEASVQSTGTIAAADIDSTGQVVTIHGLTGFGGPTYPANWFAPGGKFRTGTLRKKAVVSIVSSTATAGGLLTVHLARPLWSGLVLGSQAVTLIPSCDGQASTCSTKLNNYVNFRGMQFIPNFLQQVVPGQPPTAKK